MLVTPVPSTVKAVVSAFSGPAIEQTPISTIAGAVDGALISPKRQDVARCGTGHIGQGHKRAKPKQRALLL